MNKIILLALILFSSAKAQTSFHADLNIPVSVNSQSLKFPWAGGINYPYISAIDMNNDGRKDIFLYDKFNARILTFINNGNSNVSQAWDYAPQYEFMFPPVNSWAFLYDYNCDNKADFFTVSNASQCAGIAVYRNDNPSGSGNQWTLVNACLEETFASSVQTLFASSIFIPDFNDVDNDGDMDILGYNTTPNGRVAYHRNYSMEDYGVCDSLDFRYETGCWGNFELLVGGANEVGHFHSTCPFRLRDPSTTSESSGETQSEAARRDDTVSSLFSIDLDGNGAKELLIGDIASDNTLMIHNGGTITDAEMDTEDISFPSYDVPALFRSFHYHSYLDIDNDGVKDLLFEPNDAENKNGLWAYKNSGTDTFPVFSFVINSFLQNQMIDEGENAVPVLFDATGDGLSDLVIGHNRYDSSTLSVKSGLTLYTNVGTAVAPSFVLTASDYAGLESAGYVSPLCPAFGDLDGDGDKDMLIGREDGTFNYYQNIAGAGAAAQFQNAFSLIPGIAGMDIGKFATPQIVDVNKDGLLDILSGGQRGFINYFQNIGTTTSPVFNSVPTNDSLGCITLRGGQTTDGYTYPMMYDSAGKQRLLVAFEGGQIFQYDQIDNNLGGCFHQSGVVFHPAESSKIKFNLSVSGGDINGDGLTDILVGQSTGGAEILYQGSFTSGILEPSVLKAVVNLFPNPADNEINFEFLNVNNQLVQIEIFNITGSLIENKKLRERTFRYDTSQLTAGIYFVRVQTEQETVMKKFIVQR